MSNTLSSESKRYASAAKDLHRQVRQAHACAQPSTMHGSMACSLVICNGTVP